MWSKASLRKAAEFSPLFRSWIFDPYLERELRSLRKRIDQLVAKGQFGEAMADLLRTTYSIGSLSDIDRHTRISHREYAMTLCNFIRGSAHSRDVSPHSFDDSFTLVLSYPRSGNTLLLNILAQDGLCYVMYPGTSSYISYDPRCPPVGLDRPCLVKEHDAKKAIYFDKIIYAVRDGRNVIISLAYMLLQQGRFEVRRKEQLPDLIRYLAEKYPYGDWASNVRTALGLRDSGQGTQLLLTRYEDFKTNALDVIDFVLPHLSKSRKEALFLSGSRNAKVAYQSPEWSAGFASQDPQDPFFGWHQSRGGNYWRTAFTPEAMRAFHETGATELLIELGYETDSTWWKQAYEIP